MKKITYLAGFLFLSLAAQTMAAPKGWVDPYANLERNTFTAKKGDWDKARNWSAGKVPEGFVRTYISGGNTCTVASVVNITDGIMVGNTANKAAVLYVEKGAKIAVPSIGVPHLTQVNATGEVYMRDGEIVLQDKDGTSGAMGIGASGTTSGTGFFEIRGGKIKGGIIVGSSLPNTQAGTLSVVGRGADISTFADGRRHLILADSGTICFVLDKDGVAPLDYTNGALLGQNGKIIVDAAQYDGGTRQIVLIKASHFAYTPTVDIINVPAAYQAKTAVEKKGKLTQLMLSFSKKGGAR